MLSVRLVPPGCFSSASLSNVYWLAPSEGVIESRATSRRRPVMTILPPRPLGRRRAVGASLDPLGAALSPTVGCDFCGGLPAAPRREKSAMPQRGLRTKSSEFSRKPLTRLVWRAIKRMIYYRKVAVSLKRRSLSTNGGLRFDESARLVPTHGRVTPITIGNDFTRAFASASRSTSRSLSSSWSLAFLATRWR